MWGPGIAVLLTLGLLCLGISGFIRVARQEAEARDARVPRAGR